jgi:glycosyltransferase involved in cell wall biosynthesis
MRIGIDISVLNDPTRTGIGVYIYELTKALLKVNKKDQFVLFGLAPLAAYKNLSELEFRDYPNVEMRIFKMPSKVFRSFFLFWQKTNFPTIENFIGPVDIFHSYNWFLPPQKKGKSVATIFDMTSVAYPQWHQNKTSQLDRLRFNRINQYSDLVIAISEASQKDFLKDYPQKKVEVVYPAAKDSFKQKVTKKEIGGLLKKYHLKPDFLLSVATIEPRKNINSLVEAYLSTDINRQLVLVGASGWKNEQLMYLVKKYSDRIKLPGFVSDEELNIFYKAAYCLIYPSFYEGFGIPVLEAMVSGTAVITSKVSSLPEVGGEAVLYINPHQIDSIKQSLLKIDKDKRLRDQLTKKGFKQSQKFSWEKSAQRLNQLYQKL